jgi:anti-sigma regulatory factor (Ser/Thr protein kinase)
MEMSAPYFMPIAVDEETQPGFARREAARIAALEGLQEADVGRVSIVVTEAAKNLVKHGNGGEVLLRGWSQNGASAVDVLALDKGKGMSDVGACMRDGFSTAGTPGTGLGAMQRMSDLLDIYSVPGAGTVVHCRIGAENRLPADATERMDSGVVIVPIAGETRCGDGWAERHTDSHSVYMVVDGLGHGSGAADAADEAIAAFQRVETANPLDVLDEAHHALRKTRGAALSVASIDHNRRKVRFAGIGNVAGAIISPAKWQNMVSHNGIVGHSQARMQDFTYDWPADAMLAMYSDGITSHWNLSKYPGLQLRSPLLQAAVVYRDFSRRRDDATVLIARERAARN